LGNGNVRGPRTQELHLLDKELAKKFEKVYTVWESAKKEMTNEGE